MIEPTSESELHSPDVPRPVVSRLLGAVTNPALRPIVRAGAARHSHRILVEIVD